MRTVSISVVPGTYAVVRLPSEDSLPVWAQQSHLFSATRTPNELSIVCESDRVPAGVETEDGYRALVVDGRLDFGLTGILAGIATPLAAAGISIFALSTYETDYVLVRDRDLPRAVTALREAGHTVADGDSYSGSTPNASNTLPGRPR